MERDPNGLSANAPGSKLDAGKNRMGLVLGGFAAALEEVCKVGTFGANKYTDNGWMQVDGGKARYTDALFRHWNKECKGELRDADSGLLHAAHLAWNALARLHFILEEQQQKEQDDGAKQQQYTYEYISPGLYQAHPVEPGGISDVQEDLFPKTYWGDRPESISHGTLASRD